MECLTREGDGRVRTIQHGILGIIPFFPLFPLWWYPVTAVEGRFASHRRSTHGVAHVDECNERTLSVITNSIPVFA